MTLSYSDFDQHLIDDDLGLFTQQRMTAFGKAAIDIANDPDFDQWSFLSQNPLLHAATSNGRTGTQNPKTTQSLPDTTSLKPA